MMRSFVVRAEWDPEAAVYVATSDDVPGLVAEAPALPELAEKLRALIPELLELRAGCVEAESPKTLNPANGQRLGHLREPMRTQHGLTAAAPARR